MTYFDNDVPLKKWDDVNHNIWMTIPDIGRELGLCAADLSTLMVELDLRNKGPKGEWKKFYPTKYAVENNFVIKFDAKDDSYTPYIYRWHSTKIINMLLAWKQELKTPITFDELYTEMTEYADRLVHHADLQTQYLKPAFRDYVQQEMSFAENQLLHFERQLENNLIDYDAVVLGNDRKSNILKLYLHIICYLHSPDSRNNWEQRYPTLKRLRKPLELAHRGIDPLIAKLQS